MLEGMKNRLSHFASQVDATLYAGTRPGHGLPQSQRVVCSFSDCVTLFNCCMFIRTSETSHHQHEQCAAFHRLQEGRHWDVKPRVGDEMQYIVDAASKFRFSMRHRTCIAVFG